MLRDLILAVSLALNVALYYWAIDSVEYKKLVDSVAEKWKIIYENAQNWQK